MDNDQYNPTLRTSFSCNSLKNGKECISNILFERELPISIYLFDFYGYHFLTHRKYLYHIEFIPPTHFCNAVIL